MIRSLKSVLSVITITLCFVVGLSAQPLVDSYPADCPLTPPGGCGVGLCCENPINLCDAAIATSTGPPMGNGGVPWCTVIHNATWHQFVAGPGGTVTFDFIVMNCTMGTGCTGFQVGILGGDCNALNLVFCQSYDFPAQTVFQVVVNLTPGESYWMVVDGSCGSDCTFDATATGIDTDPPSPAIPEFSAPMTVCVGDPVSLDITNSESTVDYAWYNDPSVDGLTGPNIMTTFTSAGTYELCVEASRPCKEECACIEIEVEDPPQLSSIELNLCGSDPDGNTIFPFILSDNINQLIDGVPFDATVQFYTSFGDAQADVGELLPAEINGPNCPVASFFIYYSVTTALGCRVVGSQPLDLCIEVPNIQLAPNPLGPYCDSECVELDNPMNLTIFDQNGNTNGVITFHGSRTDAINGASPIDPPVAKADDGINPYWVRFESNVVPGCIDVEMLEVTFELSPNVIVTQPDPECATSFPYIFDLNMVDVQESTGSGVLMYYDDYDNALAGVNQIFDLQVEFTEADSISYWVVACSPQAGCCSEPVEIIMVVNEGPGVIISGPESICDGDIATFTFEFSGTPDWDLTLQDNFGNNYNILAANSPHTEDIQLGGPGQYILTVTALTDGSGGNCPVINIDPFNIDVFELPTANLNDNQTICADDCAQLNVIVTGTEPFTIVYMDGSTGAEITVQDFNIGDAIEVCPTELTTYTLISIVDSLDCIGTVNGAATVDLFEPLGFTNFDEGCAGTTYAISFEITGGDPNSYQVFGPPLGDPGVLVGANFQGDPRPTTDPYNYLIIDANMCDTVTVSGSVTICCITASGEMQTMPAIDVCVGEDVTAVYNGAFTNDGDDVLEYILHDGMGNTLGNIIARNNVAPTFSYDPNSITSGQVYYISAVAGDDDGSGNVDLNDDCLDVSFGTPVVWHDLPTLVVGAGGDICEGASRSIELTFTGAQPFTFIYTDGTLNDTLTTNDNPFNLDLGPAATTTYTFLNIADRFCDQDVSLTAEIVVNGSPSIGTVIPTCNNTNTFYSAEFDIQGGEGPYTVFGGAGTLNGNIFTSDDIIPGDTEIFYVHDVNSCDTIEVMVNTLCNCTSSAGSVNQDTLHLCIGDVATANHDGMQLLDGDDALVYVLHESPAQALSNDRFGCSDTPVFNWDTSLECDKTYYISAVVGNALGVCVDFTDPCLDVSFGRPVVWHCTPTATLLDDNQQLCAGDDLDIRFNFTGERPFTFTYIENGAVVGPITTNDFSYAITLNPAITGSISLDQMSDAYCDGPVSGQVDYQIPQAIGFTNLQTPCDLDVQQYVATFDITGGAGTGNYILLEGRGTITGSTYMSFPLVSNDPDQVMITDINNCDTLTLDFVQDCACLTNAGSMDPGPYDLCEDERVAVASNLNGQNFEDSNDRTAYALHDGIGPQLGNVVQWNIAPVFNFDDAFMTHGTTYFISQVVGDGLLGLVDLADTCLSVSPGTPVTWFPYPTADIFANTNLEFTCDLEMITLIGSNSTGFNSLRFEWQNEDNEVVGNTDILEVDAEGVYSLVVTDIIAGCTDTTSVTIQDIREDPVAVIRPPGIIDCDNNAVTLDAQLSSSGTDFDITWSHDPNETSLTPLITAAGDYTLTIVDTRNNCVASASATVNENTVVPIANAGQDRSFSCIDTEIMLNGGSSSLGPNFVYQWDSPNGFPIVNDNSLTPMVTQTGFYELTVTDTTNGCFATDIVEVNSNDAEPQLSLEEGPISCFGECDAYLVASSTGGLPPYTYSLNGGAFTALPAFFNLCEGDYQVTVRDANGCEDIMLTEFIEPEELSISFPENIAINLGDSVMLSPSIFPPDVQVQYEWSGFPDSSGVTIRDPYAKPEASTSYQLTIITDSGCEASAFVTVSVEKQRDVFVPNIFTPNVDNLNDILFISAGSTIANIRSFRVYDRWGAVQHEALDFPPADSNIAPNYWDGTFKGERKNQAVFVWYAEVEYIDGEVEVLAGDVTLIR